MDAKSLNRKCELTENKALKDTFDLLQYRYKLVDEKERLKDEISKGNIEANMDEQSFKNNYFSNHFNWNLYFIISIIISVLIGIGTWIIYSVYLGLILFIATYIVIYYTSKYMFWKRNGQSFIEYKNNLKKFKEKEPNLLHQLTNMETEISAINDSLNNSSVIPPKYQNYWPILLNYFYDCRADTLKEAINLLEQELHMMNQTKLIESLNYELQRMRMETSQASRDIKNSVDFNTFMR